MLQKLVLKNVGPAPEMELEFGSRVNIINDSVCCRVRLRYWNKFSLRQIDELTLQEFSPFVWLEAKRQGLL